jgi:hypothetical protein
MESAGDHDKQQTGDFPCMQLKRMRQPTRCHRTKIWGKEIMAERFRNVCADTGIKTQQDE